MKLNIHMLKKMLRAVIHTHDGELSCNDCFEQLDRFIELKLNGKSPEEAMPLVQEHLNRCGDCREEYEALLAALQNIESESS